MRWLSLLIPPLLAACTSNPGIQVSPDAASQLKIGISTAAQVQSSIGSPTNRIVGPNGDETWTYLYNKADVNPAVFLPYVGFWAMTMSSTPYQNQTLTLTFRNQLLSSCKFVLISGTAAAMMGTSGPAQSSTIERKCG